MSLGRALGSEFSGAGNRLKRHADLGREGGPGVAVLWETQREAARLVSWDLWGVFLFGIPEPAAPVRTLVTVQCGAGTRRDGNRDAPIPGERYYRFELSGFRW